MQIFTAEIPAFSHSQSCLTYFNFILNICNIKINRSRRYLPKPTYVRLKRDVTRVTQFLAPTFRRLLFKLNSSCLRFPSCRFRSLDGMANLFFCGISQVNIIVQSIYRWTHHKLQQKVFLRIHHQKGLQNNILRIEENLDGRTSFFSAKSKMAAKNIISSIIQ